MHTAKQAVDDVRASCQNILALTEAIDITDRKEEILAFTERIKENLSNVSNSLILIDTTLDELFSKAMSFEIGMQELMSEFDDMDMEVD